jgi:parvulin-like peptidyl-prolyl isomerase
MRKDRRMRSLLVTLVAVLMLAGALMSSAERIVLEGPMIRVNDQVVTVSDFTERLRQELTQIPAQPTDEELRQFAETLLDEMVNELVLTERAAEKRLTVEEGMIDQAIANLREENNLQDDEAWEQALASSGITVEQLRERYRRTILLQRAVQGEVRPVEITEEELRQQYEVQKEDFSVPAKVELEQLYFPEQPGGGDRTQVMRQARGLVERVRGGADLRAEATLAGVELQDLGAIPVEDLRPELQQVLEGVEDGGLSDPISTAGGVQVIRLVRRVPAGYQPFDEVKAELRRQKSAETYESQTRGLVEKLRSEYLVEVHEEYLEKVLASLGGI